MRKYVTEFIGTFFLTFTICMVVLGNAGLLAPFAIGLVLMVMIYMGGHISGAHYNPAVTIAVALRGKCDKKDIIPYWVAQLLAAVTGSLLASFLIAPETVAAITIDPTKAFIVETLFTFALAYVILNVATAPSLDGNTFYGLAIGLTVLTGIMSVGSISGAAFNPAVTLAIALAGILSWKYVALYIIAQLIGGAAAAGLFYYTVLSETKQS
jgi:aquaporin Z